VILTGSDLVAPAMKWNFSYLAEHIGPGPFGVFCHRNDTHGQQTHRTSTAHTISVDSDDNENLVSKKAKTSKKLNIFKYFDNKKLQSLEDESTFRQDIVREEMNFEEFLKKFNGDRYD